MLGQLRRIGDSELAGQNLVLAAMIVAGVFFLGIVVITPLDLVSQALFAILTIVVMLLDPRPAVARRDADPHHPVDRRLDPLHLVAADRDDCNSPRR